MSEVSSAKAARRAEAQKAQQSKKKLRIQVCAVVAALVLLILFVVLFSSNLFYNGTDALKINGVGYSVADFNYNYFSVYNSYYNDLYNTYGSMAAYLMPSTSSSLRDTDYVQGEVTWAEFFTEAALERMTRITMLCDEAKAAGFTLTQEDLEAIEETVEGLKTQASTGGFSSLQQYLTYCYGKGMTEKIFRKNLELERLASNYSTSVGDSFEYTDEELRAHYAEHKDDYDVIIYRSYYVNGNAVEDDKDTEEDETLSLEDAMAAAKEKADKILAAATDEAGYIAAINELNADNESFDAESSTKYTAQGANLSALLKDWLVDSGRKAGDVTVIETAEDATAHGYYVVFYLDRDDNSYTAVNGYYGFVPKNTTLKESDFDSTEKYEIAVKTATEKTAGEVLEEYDADSEDRYESFAAAIEGAGSVLSGGGPLTNVGRYDVPESVSEWLFDEARKEGDTTILYDEDYGCYLLYYTGADGVYADLLADSVMSGEAYDSWEKERLESYKVDTEWEMHLATKIAAIGG